MKHLFTVFLILFSLGAASQDLTKKSDEILKKGIELYRLEKASWVSTDSLSESARTKVQGYFTYAKGDSIISVYVDATKQSAAYKFTFVPTGDLEIQLLKTETNVPLTNKEILIFKVKETAQTMGMMWYDNFGYLRIVNPNVIIYKTEPKFEVYVIPGAKQAGTLPLGGDLFFRFKPDGEIDKMEQIHNNLIPIKTESPKGAISSAHQHLGTTSEKLYMTPTDVCTLLLYREYLKEEKHLCVHKKFISEFYFNEPRLVIRSNKEKLKLR